MNWSKAWWQKYPEPYTHVVYQLVLNKYYDQKPLSSGAMGDTVCINPEIHSIHYLKVHLWPLLTCSFNLVTWITSPDTPGYLAGSDVILPVVTARVTKKANYQTSFLIRAVLTPALSSCWSSGFLFFIFSHFCTRVPSDFSVLLSFPPPVRHLDAHIQHFPYYANYSWKVKEATILER